MKITPYWLGLALAAMLVAGCDKPVSEKPKSVAEGKNAEAPTSEGSDEPSYEDGKGLLLGERSRAAIGLAFVAVGKQAFQPSLSVTAQVYRAATEPSLRYGGEKAGFAYLTATLPSDTLTGLKPGLVARFKGEPREGVLWKIDTTQNAVTGKSEMLIEVPDPAGRLAVGAFVPSEIESAASRPEGLSIPATAVLKTATGTFAYVKNGDRLLRQPIQVGTASGVAVEVTEGLQEGTTVAAKSVETLYLIELRATKSGAGE
ncbi:hypothetical protein SAMN05444156_0647 [Verrucomicrobium sp. GAS474]|uniref:efflux RND transporter periplasmic adaptor subunit n=1 Tax=Verrucomicrobium sp. GAS474 TaxID=1882831 RepID=UPI00087BF4FA|nr:hypothetical protein [Verrucomicrobium sp. GAS474]SDT90928.1 hypothetical protein SAMN05444156_0647 [Verrucomicrobium sp. GAS474]